MNKSAVELSCIRDDRPWLYGRVPNGYWDVRENRISYLEWLGRRLGFVSRNDWYRVCNRDFIRNHGGTLLLKIYCSSVYIAMQDYQPQHEWIPWLFHKTPRGFWEEAENRRSYMEWIEELLRIECEEDWYQLTKESFAENSGAGLLANHYRGSILSALREYRPDYDWKPWLFPKVPHGFWSQPNNRRRYLRWLANRLRFRSPNDWHRLSRKDISETGGSGLFNVHYGGSLARLIDEVVSLKICGRT